MVGGARFFSGSASVIILTPLQDEAMPRSSATRQEML